jgi:hypothetical protein
VARKTQAVLSSSGNIVSYLKSKEFHYLKVKHSKPIKGMQHQIPGHTLTRQNIIETKEIEQNAETEREHEEDEEKAKVECTPTVRGIDRCCYFISFLLTFVKLSW